MNISEDKAIDVVVKDLEQSMTTYRYLADMNVKYVMFFLIVCGFTLKIYVDANDTVLWLILFLGATGAYSANSISLVYKRMQGLSSKINELEKSLNMEENNFVPFMKFLSRTCTFIVTMTFAISLGMFFHHPPSEIVSYNKSHHNAQQAVLDSEPPP